VRDFGLNTEDRVSVNITSETQPTTVLRQRALRKEARYVQTVRWYVRAVTKPQLKPTEGVRTTNKIRIVEMRVEDERIARDQSAAKLGTR
jgi:hypothetical protein